MLGMILAAGAGRRLRPYTDTLPKALVPVDGDTTIMDIALQNLASVGLTDVVVIVGYRSEAVEERREALERRHGVKITTVFNDKAEEWNNAYSCGLHGTTSLRAWCWSTVTPCTRPAWKNYYSPTGDRRSSSR